jgi:hypothetical protein
MTSLFRNVMTGGKMRSLKVTVAAFLLLTAMISMQAAELRLVILPKMTVEGKDYDSSGLEMEVTNTLTHRNMRIVELSTALKAQAAALSDMVNEGKVPKELSVMNADALVSVQVACDQSSGGIMGSNLKSWFCVFTTKVVRVDSGDVIHGSSKNFTAPGLNALQAISNAMKKNVGKDTDAYAEVWTKSWSNEGKWSLDLIVTGIAEKKKVDEISAALKGIEGVKSSQVVMFKKDLSKITVSGEGSENFAKLREALDSDASLSLRINYEAGRVIHAEFDFSQAYSRGVAAYINTPKDAGKKSMAALIADKGPDILKSYLMNLEYFEIKSSSMLKDKKEKAIADAKKSNIPLVLFTEVVEKDNDWLAIVELLFSSDGKNLSVVKGTAGDPFEAMDKALRMLDESYRKAVTRGEFRKKLNLTKEAEGLAAASRLAVDKFDVGQIFPSLVGFYRENGIGSMTLKNTSGSPLSDIEITYKVGDQVVGSAKVDDIPVKGSTVTPVKLAVIPESGKGFSQIHAQITFRSGDVYGRRDAYSPLMIHSKNIIDWSNPQTLASFIDPVNPMVRDLATSAIMKKAPKELVTKQVANAAFVFESLWNKPLKYVSDPVATSFDSNIDNVQYPAETLSRLAGDCDDLTVLLASLYESVGLATIIITTPGHVLLGVDSGALAGGSVLFNLPGSLFIEVDGALFIPVESTAIGVSFAEAWLKAADLVNKTGGNFMAFRTREAWKKYPFLPITAEKNNLNAVKPDDKKIAGMLGDVRKNVKEKTPEWAVALHSNIVSGKTPEIKPDTLSKTPVAKSVVLWLVNEREKAIEEAAVMCGKGVVEACYNMTVMSMYDALERSDMQTIDANMTKNNYADAVSMLPANVINMLSDNGGLGMGDEATKESETRKRIAEVLAKAREKGDKKASAATTSKEIKTTHVGGRKASDSSEFAGATAEMFFWGTIKPVK